QIPSYSLTKKICQKFKLKKIFNAGFCHSGGPFQFQVFFRKLNDFHLKHIFFGFRRLCLGMSMFYKKER
ncbi:hypothetical protein CGSSp19BS75_01253, partial [Streptococcus pneumoniae SP19-BS75]